jgi:cytochrome c peroxidase
MKIIHDPRRFPVPHCIPIFLGIGLLVAQTDSGDPQKKLPDMFPFPNEAGVLRTHNTSGNGDIDLTGPFFQSLGTNGRTCNSCHKPDQAWAISAAATARLFEETKGTDPIFRTNDGSNCDHNIDTSSVNGRRQAYSLLTSRGVFRISLDVPAGAEYDVVSVNNPYGCAELTTISAYRRPLPTTNLKFLSTVMWDGRESTPPSTQKITFATNPGDLLFDLAHQSLDATNGHAQASTALTARQQQQIVDFEMHLFTAQDVDKGAGDLDSHGATGGPVALSHQDFFVGINDPLGGNPHGTAFTPVIFNLFDAWAANHHGHADDDDNGRASIVRGQALFNDRRINITGVAGLNDVLNTTVIPGNCGTCHSSPNAGNHSVSLPINIGVADLSSPLNVSYLPVVTLKNKTTGQIAQTTDPGRALITGKWADIGKFKGPVLRGLAARAPYFHNGSARDLRDVVDFYNIRFAVGLTDREERDLVAFLNTL